MLTKFSKPADVEKEIADLEFTHRMRIKTLKAYLRALVAQAAATEVPLEEGGDDVPGA